MKHSKAEKSLTLHPLPPRAVLAHPERKGRISIPYISPTKKMDQSAEGKWNACLENIRKQLPPQEFKTWFEPLKFVDFQNGKLKIGVPTKYVGQYISSHHRDLIAGALLEAFDASTRLFWQDEEAMNQWRKEESEREERQKRTAQAVGTRDIDPSNRSSQLPPLNPRLNPDYTFQSFVEGNSNKLALNVALSIAENPGQATFNPFFLYGPSGVGKTHLVNALGVKLHELYPDKRVLFVSAHVFKTQYTDSVIHNTTNDFINFYQSIDTLIIDDIQEITTAKTQQAFFHIFNHLQQNRRQLVMTCDRPPVLFEGIEERMLTRFKWGMIAEMEKPDQALRRAILQSKIKRDGLDFPDEVVRYIAQNVESSVRELEGIVNSIMAYSVVDNCEIDLPLTARVVARAVNLEKKDLGHDDIIGAVCSHCGVKQKDIVSKSRRQAIVGARQLAMYLIHKYTGESYAQIGRAIGRRDHSTVVHSCNQISRRITRDRDFRHEVEELEAALKK